MHAYENVDFVLDTNCMSLFLSKTKGYMINIIIFHLLYKNYGNHTRHNEALQKKKMSTENRSFKLLID